jgi:hypothetical protein
MSAVGIEEQRAGGQKYRERVVGGAVSEYLFEKGFSLPSVRQDERLCFGQLSQRHPETDGQSFSV